MQYEVSWRVLWDYSDILWMGLTTTIWISAVCVVTSTLLGAVAGLLGVVPSRPMRLLVAGYVEVMRNTPAIVKIFFLYFALNLGATTAAIVGLTLHQSGYIAEVVRAAIRSVPGVQVEAALSSGLKRLQIARWVVVPQALDIMIPPLTNQYVELIKNSSVAMTVGITELTFQTQQIEFETLRGFEVATAVTVAYMGLALVATATMHWLERKVRVSR
jgi:polar amino acid transport system permease protein